MYFIFVNYCSLFFCTYLYSYTSKTKFYLLVVEELLSVGDSRKHMTYQHPAELTDESAIRDSIEYFESVKRMGTAVFKLFDAWLQSAQFKLQEELDLAISLHPEDSISNIGSTKSKSAAGSRRRKSKSSASSSLSQSSTTSSARLRASANFIFIILFIYLFIHG